MAKKRAVAKTKRRGRTAGALQKQAATKAEASGLLTADAVLVALTPAMRKKLRQAIRIDGRATIRLEPRATIRLGRVLRAYPVMDPPN